MPLLILVKKTAIVIGINQAEESDPEYTPFVNEDNPKAHGDKFAGWVVRDLKNWVDSNFSTLPKPSNTAIGGISRSRMMVYYMLMAQPGVFGNALIQSPSMWVDYERQMEMSLSSAKLENKRIMVSVGEYEGRSMIPHAKAIFEKFKDLGLKDNQLRFEIIPGEGHWHLTWRKSIALFYPLVDGIEGHQKPELAMSKGNVLGIFLILVYLFQPPLHFTKKAWVQILRP